MSAGSREGKSPSTECTRYLNCDGRCPVRRKWRSLVGLAAFKTRTEWRSVVVLSRRPSQSSRLLRNRFKPFTLSRCRHSDLSRSRSFSIWLQASWEPIKESNPVAEWKTFCLYIVSRKSESIKWFAMTAANLHALSYLRAPLTTSICDTDA